MSQPKVSVILPIYNVAPYLDDAFQSLLAQSLTDFEIIAVNDGATDDSQDYIDKYCAADPRIKCVRQANRGLSGARNTGMRHVSGEYVYFMDSDDILEPDALECCYRYARRHDAEVCLFDAEVFYEPGARPLAWDYHRSEVLQEDRQYDGRELFAQLLDNGHHRAVVWLQFIKWSHLQHTGLDFYEGIIHEDELFTPQLMLQSCRVFCLKRSFIRHRVRSSSIVGRGYSSRNLNCYLTVFDELFRREDSPVVRQFARYTLSKVFYTGHVIPLREKPRVFWRALRSGYVRYIGLKSALVFWLKR